MRKEKNGNLKTLYQRFVMDCNKYKRNFFIGLLVMFIALVGSRYNIGFATSLTDELFLLFIIFTFFMFFIIMKIMLPYNALNI